MTDSTDTWKFISNMNHWSAMKYVYCIIQLDQEKGIHCGRSKNGKRYASPTPNTTQMEGLYARFAMQQYRERETSYKEALHVRKQANTPSLPPFASPTPRTQTSAELVHNKNDGDVDADQYDQLRGRHVDRVQSRHRVSQNSTPTHVNLP
jgi:hypothetical protein